MKLKYLFLMMMANGAVNPLFTDLMENSAAEATKPSLTADMISRDLMEP